MKRERTLRAQTLKALERAAMRWYRSNTWLALRMTKDDGTKLFHACASHAAARKKERK